MSTSAVGAPGGNREGTRWYHELLGAGLAILVILGVAWVVGWLQPTGWPGFLAVLSAILWLSTRRSTAPWTKAIASIALPACCAFVAMVIAALLITRRLGTEDLTSTTAAISTFEATLVRMSTSPPWWLAFTKWKLAILVALYPAAVYLPRWRLTRKFLAVKRFLGVATASLNIFASFSVFATPIALGRVSEPARRHVAFVYGQSKAREQLNIVDRAARQATAEALAGLSISQRRQLVALWTAIESAQAKPEAADAIAEEIAWSYGPSPGLRLPPGATAADERQAAEDVANRRLEVFADASRIIDDQRQEARRVEGLNDEARKTLEAVFDSVLSYGSSRPKRVARAFIETVLRAQGMALLPEISSYLDRVFDNYVDDKTKPIVQRYASKLQDALSGRTPAPPLDRPELAVNGAVNRLATARPQALLKWANARTADAEAQRDDDRAKEQIEQARSAVGEAVQLTLAFGGALPDAGQGLEARLPAAFRSEFLAAASHISKTERGIKARPLIREMQERLRTEREREIERRVAP